MKIANKETIFTKIDKCRTMIDTLKKGHETHTQRKQMDSQQDITD